MNKSLEEKFDEEFEANILSYVYSDTEELTDEHDNISKCVKSFIDKHYVAKCLCTEPDKNCPILHDGQPLPKSYTKDKMLEIIGEVAKKYKGMPHETAIDEIRDKL